MATSAYKVYPFPSNLILHHGIGQVGLTTDLYKYKVQHTIALELSLCQDARPQRHRFAFPICFCARNTYDRQPTF